MHIRPESAREVHAPQRTCIGCRRAKAKADLIRLVRTNDGEVVVDRAKKRPGRGVYLCPARECWEMGLKQRKLGHSRWPEISPADRGKLLAFSTSFPLDREPTRVAKAQAQKELHIGH